MQNRTFDSKAETRSALSRQPAEQQREQAGHPLLELQRLCGNRFAQRVLFALARKDQGEAEVSPEVEQAIQRARGRGQALGGEVRAQMEPAFGADFSGVRVHTDSEADKLNRALSARAFTTGRDIFFRRGAYNPGSSSGRELLAHELAHVVQQMGGGPQRKLTLGQPEDEYEVKAGCVARAVIQQEQDQALVQRQSEGETGRRIQAKTQTPQAGRNVVSEVASVAAGRVLPGTIQRDSVYVRERRRARQASDAQIDREIAQTRRQLASVERAIHAWATWGALAIGVVGILIGALAGAFVGGPVGAIIGAILGVVAGVVGHTLMARKLDELKGLVQDKLRAWEEEKMLREREAESGPGARSGASPPAEPAPSTGGG